MISQRLVRQKQNKIPLFFCFSQGAQVRFEGDICDKVSGAKAGHSGQKMTARARESSEMESDLVWI